jgi:hypothetical protein
LVTVTPTSAPTPHTNCINNLDYKYEAVWKDGKIKERSCGNIGVDEDRRQRLCMTDEVEVSPLMF